MRINRRQVKVMVLSFFAMLLPLLASAKVEINGIYYNLDKDTKQAEVKSGDNYSGSITIPTTVTYEGVEYSVTSIGRYAFDECRNLTAITIPKSVTYIGEDAFYKCTRLTTVHISDITAWCNIIFYDSWSNPLGSTTNLYLNGALVTKLTLPENVTSIGAYAFSDYKSLTSITIPESVMTIGENAFSSCSSLTEVNISDIAAWCNINFSNSASNPLYYAKNLYLNGKLVTELIIPESVTSIGSSAFENCSNLTSITISESVTSMGDGAFSGCSSLTSITIPESVTSMGDGVFYGCSSLTSITIPKSVTSIGNYAFSGTIWYDNLPDGLIYINDVLYKYKGAMPKNTNIEVREGTVSIGGTAFSGCSDLKFITIPESVTSIGDGAFSGCSSLTSITIPKGVTSIGDGAFNGCDQLIKVFNCSNLPISKGSNDYGKIGRNAIIVLNGESTARVGDFQYITSEGVHYLTDYIGNDSVLILPEKFKDDDYKICDYAFYLRNDITSVSIPESVTSIGHNAFYKCLSLTSVDIPESSHLTSIGDQAFQGCENFTTFNIPKGVINIGSNAFHYCWNLTSVTIPKSMTTIKEGAFSYCGNLSSVTIPESVTKIENNAFDFCEVLDKVINYSNLPITKGSDDYGQIAKHAKVVFNGKDFTTVDDFQYITNNGTHYLVNYIGNDETLILPPNYKNEIYKIADYAFIGCSQPKSIIIPEGITTIGDYAFESCRKLTSITLPESITNIGDWAFFSCRELASITIPKGVTKIGEYTFSYCFNLGSIDIPEGVTSIGDCAFELCRSLTSITLPESVTEIGDRAFEDCRKLTSITIPKNVTSIGDFVFEFCNSLSDVYCYAENIPSTGRVVFLNLILDNMTLHVPAKAIESYKNTTPWSDFGTIVGLPKYLISFVVDDIVYYTDSIEQGSEISLLEEPIKEGYTFSGWSEVPATMPANDIIISGRFDINSYLVTFKIGDEVIASDSLEYGAAIVVPEVPEKVGYTFSGWGEVADSVPANDLIYEGNYSVNSYILTYAIDGETYQSDTLTYGETIQLIAEPTREGHTFSGWSEAPAVMPADSVVVTGSFEVNSYLLSYTVDGDTVSTDSIYYGTEIIPLAEPEKKGHTFGGWSEIPKTMPAKDVTISGIFTINKYLVTFKIGDEVITADSLEYMSAIVAPEAPVKEGHTFNGWGEVADSVPANDLTYEGSYTVNSYLLTYTVDGEVVKSDSVDYGTPITALAEPEKEGYTFSGWSEVPDNMPAMDVTISGIFTINKYLVTFKIGDEVIAADSLEYKSGIIAPEAPEKEGHTFKGWGEVADSVPANDLTYEGSYTVNTYLLTYTVDGEVVKSDSVDYGTPITALAEPEKEGYTFSGWSEVPDTMPAMDVTISGIFTINKYLVTFKIGDEVIASDSLEFGAFIITPEVPEKEGYTFDGWGDVEKEVPAHDLTYEGSYTVNTYNVYYYVGDELVHTAEVAYGEAIPEYVYEPTEEGYTFLGWIGDTYETMPAHDVTYIANIDDAIEELTIDKSQLAIYDLQGRKVLNTENLKGGVYIINGKQVLIK